MRPRGLYCAKGDFYIDPSGKVERAVLTHAHSDHARKGSAQYYSTKSGAPLVRCRLGHDISIQGIEFGTKFRLGPVALSFHPAGHIMGSAQVRLECDGEVWGVSGDYKRESDPTCEPFEVFKCDTYVSEATFGTPSYRWKKNKDVGREIFDWFEENSAAGRNTVVFGYSLGKTQRLLGLLEPYMNRPIFLHPSAKELTQCYRDEGFSLAETICLDDVKGSKLRGELIIGPQSMLTSKYLETIGEDCKTAFASGWMARHQRGYDRGFVLSDHADWDDLIQTITETEAQEVYVLHRDGVLVRHLKSLGLRAYPISSLTPLERAKNPVQLSLL
ncbi:MAG: ligase-associated DNA damage response exonuclease [Bdellovibrionia bacterium]